ncbi:hypothetical protein ACWGH8_38120 [Nonomuraea muscovyensis]|uniref:Membrane protein involved in colicin uptake n=1 Tax=Nonomuraea muscovyensis TaxID=1124761 RepID=A0A7X0C3R5_9ACTN|nr:hypothetical protein [Nonomuraea muscovyensis]MBB6346526.1 membrane protein involved in colicin uptake [Nonomuraea muscovyensis]MDF2712039.1 hypothetical protein [Nonomuraea muscovyensis]
MIFLGLLLVLLAGGAIAWVATEDSTGYNLFGYMFEPSHVEMFAAGAVTAAVLFAGLALMAAGSRHAARRRRQMRSAKAEASHRVARLEDEKRELERRLEREQAAERQQAEERRQAAEHERAAERERAAEGRHAAAQRTTAEHPVPRQATGDRLVARGSEDTRP